MGAKVARMSLYVRGLAEPMLLLLAVVLASGLGGTLRSLAVAHTAAALVVAALAVAACARVFGGARLRGRWARPDIPASRASRCPSGHPI